MQLITELDANGKLTAFNDLNTPGFLINAWEQEGKVKLAVDFNTLSVDDVETLAVHLLSMADTIRSREPVVVN